MVMVNFMISSRRIGWGIGMRVVGVFAVYIGRGLGL